MVKLHKEVKVTSIGTVQKQNLPRASLCRKCLINVGFLSIWREEEMGGGKHVILNFKSSIMSPKCISSPINDVLLELREP
jgi:hypothetical protein